MFYALITTTAPVFATRASPKHTHESIIEAAQKTWAWRKWPVPMLRSVPATGVPTSMPNPEMLKLIPMRVPTLCKSSERETMVVGGSETNEPEKKPYRIAKTRRSPVSSTAIHDNATVPQASVHGMSVLSVPMRSASALGKMRPKTEDALRIGTK